MTVKMLRRAVVKHLQLGSFLARTLKDSRWVEFGELATAVIQEMLAKLQEPMPDIPNLLLDMTTSIY